MDFKYLVVAYWHSSFDDLPFEHLSKVSYTDKRKTEFVDHILKAGYNVMLEQSSNKETLTIWIDNRRFSQR